MLCSKVIIEQKMADLELAILRQEELIKSQREVISSLKELLYSEIYKVWPPAPQVTNPPINPNNTTTYQPNEQNKTYASSPQIPPPPAVAAQPANGQLPEDNLPFSTSFLSTINPIEPAVQSKKRRSPLPTDNQTKPNELSNNNNQNKVLISGPVSSTTNDTRKKAKVSTPPPEDQIPKTLQLQNPQPASTTSSVTTTVPVRLSINLPPKSKIVSAIKRRALEKTNQFVSTIPKFTMYKYSSSTPISSSKTTKPENNNNNNTNNYHPSTNGNLSSNELNYTTPLPNASKRKATSSNSKALLNNTTSPFVSLTDVDEEYPILPPVTTSELNNKPKIPSPPHNNNNLQQQMNDYYEELKSKSTFVDRVNAIKDFDKQLNSKHKEFSKNLLDDQGKFLLTNWLTDIDLDIKPDRDTGDYIKSTLHLLNIAHWTAKDVVLVRVDKTIRKIYKKFSNYRHVLGDETLNFLREIWSKFRYLYQESNERGPNLDIDG